MVENTSENSVSDASELRQQLREAQELRRLADAKAQTAKKSGSVPRR
jgi:hypothetical protein